MLLHTCPKGTCITFYPHFIRVRGSTLSIPSLYLWYRTAPMPIVLASRARPNGTFGSKCTRTSVEVSTSLILLKLSSHSADQ